MSISFQCNAGSLDCHYKKWLRFVFGSELSYLDFVQWVFTHICVLFQSPCAFIFPHGQPLSMVLESFNHAHLLVVPVATPPGIHSHGLFSVNVGFACFHTCCHSCCLIYLPVFQPCWFVELSIIKLSFSLSSTFLLRAFPFHSKTKYINFWHLLAICWLA